MRLLYIRDSTNGLDTMKHYLLHTLATVLALFLITGCTPAGEDGAESAEEMAEQHEGDAPGGV
jgi:hypothetical protein